MRAPHERAVVDREPPPDPDVAEILLLLPAAQAAELEETARRHGLTLARVLRALINEYLRRSAQATAP
jgi:hypothetical protein